MSKYIVCFVRFRFRCASILLNFITVDGGAYVIQDIVHAIVLLRYVLGFVSALLAVCFLSLILWFVKTHCIRRLPLFCDKRFENNYSNYQTNSIPVTCVSVCRCKSKLIIKHNFVRFSNSAFREYISVWLFYFCFLLVLLLGLDNSTSTSCPSNTHTPCNVATHTANVYLHGSKN